MSYYALFQGWLLLSQPPGCLGTPTTFATQPVLGALSWRSGLFPSRRRRLAPAASLGDASAVGIHGLVGVGNRQTAPSPSSALPPTEHPPPAVPPYISGRTSYLRVRLEFLPYPQVIPRFCNTGGFGPRPSLTSASPCPWIAHPVSGLIPATRSSLVDGNARFRLAFAAAPRLSSRARMRSMRPRPLNLSRGPLAAPARAADMNSPDHSTKGTPLGRRSSHLDRPSPSDGLWVPGFRVSFIPLSGCFSPFPHGTRALSVARQYLALEGGPPCFPQASTWPVVLRLSRQPQGVARAWPTGLSPALVGLSRPLRLANRASGPSGHSRILAAGLQPRAGRTPRGLGCSRFARHYSGNLCC